VIVVGRTPRAGWRRLLGRSVSDGLIRLARDVDVHVVTREADDERPRERRRARRVSNSRTWPVVALALLAPTLMGFGLHPWLNPTNIVMLYLAGVAVVAARAGPGESALAAVAGMLTFDFCFVPPRFAFAVADAEYLVTFAMMLGVSLLISTLSTRIRQALIEADVRERRTADLYALGRDLTRAHRKTEIANAVRRRLGEALGCEVGILYTGDEHKRQLGSEPCAKLDASDERAVAEWAADHSEPAGKGAATLPGSDGYYGPLRAGDCVVGVLAVFAPEPLDTPARDLAMAYADQAALALERTALAKQAQAARLANEQEKLRNALLSWVSHDLRTPLTAVVGAAETVLSNPSIAEETRRELVTTIDTEATRLSRLVGNLLQMTRLDAGQVKLAGDWVHFEELIAGAIERCKSLLVGRAVTTHVEPLLPLQFMDPILMEQVLVNLIENAVRYSPPDSPVEVVAMPSGGYARVELRDRGRGFPLGRAAEMFAKFARGPDEAGDGFGLGLAICRAIVEAHGGRIWARNRPEGGASVIMEFRFPDNPPPELPDE
ncbi:MAG: DUF4118 domain-containing protein, partial [Armatimonadetes bacterium]|nr:DUF4118 domain-containing protein [Armatimonadota bacterium]